MQSLGYARAWPTPVTPASSCRRPPAWPARPPPLISAACSACASGSQQAAHNCGLTDRVALDRRVAGRVGQAVQRCRLAPEQRFEQSMQAAHKLDCTLYKWRGHNRTAQLRACTHPPLGTAACGRRGTAAPPPPSAPQRSACGRRTGQPSKAKVEGCSLTSFASTVVRHANTQRCQTVSACKSRRIPPAQAQVAAGDKHCLTPPLPAHCGKGVGRVGATVQ